MRPFLILAMLGLSACALVERDPRSGYDSDGIGRAEDFYQERQQSAERDAREELGYGSRPLEDNERAVVENRVRLKRLESRLGSQREKRQYYGVRSSLKNDRERIQFLSLPSFEARDRWIQSRGLGGDEDKRTDQVNQIIENNDIALGMSKKAVMESWGDPDAVENAGNPMYGFERWLYNRYVSGSEGYQQESRIVYFEGGRVSGWERPK